MRSRTVLLTACSALALTGCGGAERSDEPRIERGAALELAGRSDAVAERVDAGDVCGAAHRADELKAATQAGIADGRVPGILGARLLAAADALVAELNCPPPPEPPDQGGDEGPGKGKEKGKHKGKDK
jgi:hypothetical protein